MVDEFGWSHASVSFAFALRAEIGGIAAPAVGLIVDRFGARRLLVLGVVIVSIGSVLMSQVNTLISLYASVLVIAIGMSATAGAVGMVVITRWFERERGWALALATTGIAASGLMVLLLEFLISQFGWRDALIYAGIGHLLLCLPLAFVIHDDPAKLGLFKDGDTHPPGGQETEKLLLGLSLKRALGTGSFWKLSLVFGLTLFGLTAVVIHQIPYFTSSLGISSGWAAASVSVMTAMTIVGRLGFGRLADLIDKRYVMAIASTMSGIALLMFATLYETWQIFYAVPFFAVAMGGSIPVRPALQAEYFGLKSFGGIQGITLAIASLGTLSGPVFAGWMYDTTESYRLAFAALSVTCVAAVPLAISIRRPM